MSKWAPFSAVCLPLLFLSVFFLSCQSTQQTKSPSATPEAQRISKERLRKMLDDPRLVLIDTRVKQQWDKAEFKLPGARHASPWEPEEWGKELSRDQIVVTYCS